MKKLISSVKNLNDEELESLQAAVLAELQRRQGSEEPTVFQLHIAITDDDDDGDDADDVADDAAEVDLADSYDSNDDHRPRRNVG